MPIFLFVPLLFRCPEWFMQDCDAGSGLEGVGVVFFTVSFTRYLGRSIAYMKSHSVSSLFNYASSDF